MTDAAFPAVALAGGSLEVDFRKAGYDVPNKAYLEVGGELMLARVLRALRGARSVGEIRCVTPQAAAARFPELTALCDRVVEPGHDLIGSVLTGFAGLADDTRVLVVATDLPLLTPAAVDRFAELVDQTPCDLGYGFVERGAHDRRYGSMRHTWVRLREGTFCGGGVSVIRAGAIGRVESVLRDFTGARKSPAKMASLFSPSLAISVLLGRLSIGELERRADQLTQLHCRGILCPDPELAVNIDRLVDLRVVETYLRPRNAL